MRNPQPDPRPSNRLSNRPTTRPSSLRRPVVDLAGVTLAGPAVGVLTAYAQGWLTGDLNSLANSAGPWSLVAFGLALATRGGPVLAAASGTIALVMLELGYVLGSAFKGNDSAMSTIVFWVAAGVVVGPALGLGAHWVRRARGVRPALGAGLISGILAGEACYAYTSLGFEAYGIGEFVAGAALLGALAAWRLRWPRLIALAAVFAVVVAAVLVIVYRTA